MSHACMPIAYTMPAREVTVSEPKPSYETDSNSADWSLPQLSDDLDVLPTGYYLARVDNVTMLQGQYDKLQCNWVFQLTAPAFDGRTLLAWSGAAFRRGSKLFSWVQELQGEPIAPDYTLRRSDLLGRECVLFLEPLEKPDKTYMKVADVHSAATAASVQLIDEAPEVDYSEPLPDG